MKKISLVLAIAFGAVFFAWSQTNCVQAKTSPLDGTWELAAGQQLPKGARNIKIISGGHFIFAAYDTKKGNCLVQEGGTYILNGSSYTEHVDLGDRISAGVVGKDQQFKLKIDGDTFVQAGTLSNGRGLSETWKRVNWFADTLAFSFLGVVTGVGAATRNEREDKLSWVDKWEYFSCGRGGRHFCSRRAAGSSTGRSHTFHTLSADRRMPRSATFTRGRK